MKTALTSQRRNILTFLILGTLIAVAYIGAPDIFKAQNAESASTDNVSGWAWSENIGWISANCATDGTCGGLQNYGVNIDLATGNLGGLAWSENIGYISFNRTETGNPPEAPFNGGSGPIANYNSATGAITGWARALSGKNDPQAGGWDGWIKLSGNSIAKIKGVDTVVGTYGVTLSTLTSTFGGFAWGSTVVGWIDFGPSTAGAGWKFTAPACTPAGVTSWGSCVGTTVCSAANVGAPIMGNQTGSCPFGGTASQSCNTGNVCPAVVVCGDLVCTPPGESVLSCPKDCKGTIKQF